VTTSALAADGRWQALGTGAGQVLLAELSGSRMHRLEVAGGAGVTALAFSADGNRLLTGSGRGALELWDVRTGRRLVMLSGGGSAVTAVFLDGDGGKALEGRADGALGHWDVRERRLVLRLPVHRQTVTGVALLPPAPALRGVSVSRDGLARLWDLPGGAAGPALEGHGPPLQALAASEDGGLILTGDEAGVARLFGPEGRLRAQGRLPGAISAVAFAQGRALRLVAGPAFPVQVFREAPLPAPSRGRPASSPP
jgi:WD40 repeat protein